MELPVTAQCIVSIHRDCPPTHHVIDFCRVQSTMAINVAGMLYPLCTDHLMMLPDLTGSES